MIDTIIIAIQLRHIQHGPANELGRLHALLISLLLGVQDLIGERKVLCDQLGTLLLLLLDLSHQVLDHVFLRLVLTLHYKVLLHGLFGLLDDLEVHLTHITHLVNDGLQIFILLLQFDIFLDHIAQLRVIHLLQLLELVRLKTTRELLMLEFLEQNVGLLVAAAILGRLLRDIHLVVVKFAFEVLQN